MAPEIRHALATDELAVASIWSVALGNASQVAIGLSARPGRTFARAALERLVHLEIAGAAPDDPFITLRVRAYVLELALGLRLARSRLPSPAGRASESLCAQLEAATKLTPGLFDSARAVLAAFDEPLPEDQSLAWRIRRRLEEVAPARMPAERLAEEFKAEAWWIRRVFKRTHGVTLGAFYRRLCGQRAVEAVRETLVLKVAVDLAGCSERTLRRRVVQATGLTPSRIRKGPPPETRSDS